MATSSLDYNLPRPVCFAELTAISLANALSVVLGRARVIHLYSTCLPGQCLSQDKTDFRYGSKADFLGKTADAPRHRHLQAAVGEIVRNGKNPSTSERNRNRVVLPWLGCVQFV